MIIFLLSVWFFCSRNLHKNKNVLLPIIFFSMHGNSRENAAQILDVHSDFNKIISEKKLWSYFC